MINLAGLSGAPCTQASILTSSSHSRRPQCPSKIQISASIQEVCETDSANGDLSEEYIGVGASSHRRDKEYKDRSERLLALVQQVVRQCRRIRIIEPPASESFDTSLREAYSGEIHGCSLLEVAAATKMYREQAIAKRGDR